MKFLVTGSRSWESNDRIEKALLRLWLRERDQGQPTMIVGGAAGVDLAAESCWRKQGLPVEVFRADWVRYGKPAGYIRNQLMVAQKPDLCLAFIRNDSRGATMCAGLAEQAGIPVTYYREVGPADEH